MYNPYNYMQPPYGTLGNLNVIGGASGEPSGEPSGLPSIEPFGLATDEPVAAVELKGGENTPEESKWLNELLTQKYNSGDCVFTHSEWAM